MKKYTKYENKKDIYWYNLDRDFYLIKDPAKTKQLGDQNSPDNQNAEILNFLEDKDKANYGLFMKYLVARRDLAFIYGMYELSYFHKVVNVSEKREKPSYTLMNKLKEAKTHFRLSSSLGGIIEPKILRELKHEEVDGNLNEESLDYQTILHNFIIEFDPVYFPHLPSLKSRKLQQKLLK